MKLGIKDWKTSHRVFFDTGSVRKVSDYTSKSATRVFEGMDKKVVYIFGRRAFFRENATKPKKKDQFSNISFG